MKRRRYLIITLMAAVVLCASTAPAADYRGITVAADDEIPRDAWGTYHALIIGINDYQQWPQLRTAVKDATVLARVLTERYGFSPDKVIVRTDKDASRLQILRDIRSLATAMKPEDNLLLYFAGHGQLDDLTGDGYWIPVEGAAQDPGTWIPNSFIKAVFSSEQVKAKNVVVIADSCYSGAMLRGGPSLLTLDGDYQAKLVKAAARRSRQVISSGGVEPVADGGADGHSLFAYYFITALKENDSEIIDLENLFHTRVWKPVTEIGNQRPSVGRLKSPMDRDGQFVLYNQGWVAEQRLALVERQRRDAEAARLKAETADRSAAVQAERQRLEIERQKLEMEKELMAQKQQLEIGKLELEKQKQAMEMQKMAAQLAAMKQRAAQAEAPLPPVAAVSPKTIQPTPRPAGGAPLSAALLPMYIRGLSASATGYMNKWGEDSVRGLKLALGRDQRIKLTQADKPWGALSGLNVGIANDIIGRDAKDRLWEKASFFDTLAAPVVDEAVALGEKLGVDIVFLIRIGADAPMGSGDAYIIDILSKKVTQKGGQLGSGSGNNFKKFFSQAIDDYFAGR